jgi:hypothetical protein
MVSGLLGIGLGLIVMRAVSAAESGTSPAARKTPSAEPTAASPASSAQADAAARETAKREKALQEWRAKLTGTRWELQLTPTGAQGGAPETDVLTFSERTIGSENLVKQGYAVADTYALYSPTERSVAWEAMQVKEEQGTRYTAIWRGEAIGETMQGTLLKQRSLGDANLIEQLSWTGRLLAPAPEAAQPPAGESAPADPSSATADPPSAGSIED